MNVIKSSMLSFHVFSASRVISRVLILGLSVGFHLIIILINSFHDSLGSSASMSTWIMVVYFDRLCFLPDSLFGRDNIKRSSG